MNSVFRKFLFATLHTLGDAQISKPPFTDKRGAEKSHILCKYGAEVEVYLCNGVKT